MKNTIGLFLIIAMMFNSCNCDKNENSAVKSSKNKFIGEFFINEVIDSLTNKFGKDNMQGIQKGVTQAAGLWTEKDGSENEFLKFCMESYVAEKNERHSLFMKLSRNYEILNGYFNRMSIELKKPLHMDVGTVSRIDEIFGSYEPASHVAEDFFNNKTAFLVCLNFPYYSLYEKVANAEKWSSEEWAYARLGDLYTSRVPSDLLLKLGEKVSEADTYISEYNIYMGKLVNDNEKQLFPDDMKLISHWGLRDELKSNYNSAEGLEKQRMIYEVMKKIITQEVPMQVINKNDFKWNPTSNRLYNEEGDVHANPEPDTRYQHLLNVFLAQKEMDVYNPFQPTYIVRKFDSEMELSQQEVEKLFVDYVSSPVVKEVAKLIKSRLGRNLEPFDIWYDGFKARSSMSETELDKMTQKRYPTVESFQKDLPEIIGKLGFAKERAEFLCSKITVDASRGAGHAWGAEMKSDNSRLRTRIASNGMNYKGYNIAIHEFGHNVEQTISLHDVDYYTMRGVPNTAFTEALAFVFQERDLDLLGINNEDANRKHLMALDNFWSTYEIMGVSLVDMRVWQWLYEHPEANATELKAAVNEISKEIWNKYYADVFGVKDSPILAIYSHMIDAPLYLSAYPIGLIIQFQLEKHLESNNFAQEVDRIYRNGRLIPQFWMKKAVGREISPEPMIMAAKDALNYIK
jgi:hypothetical protein